MGIKGERELAADLHEVQSQWNKVVFPPDIFCSPLLELDLFLSDDRVATEQVRGFIDQVSVQRAQSGGRTKQNHSQNWK